MKASHIGVIVLVLSGLSIFSANAADLQAGKSKTAVCAGCHGPDGNSVSPTWPSLAGQHATYIYKQLKDFKEGRRIDPTMSGMVAMLNDEDMRNVAAYYESLSSKPVAFDAELIAAGESIYRDGITETSVAACVSCHSPSGMGNGPAGWPSLKGQHANYLVAQMQKFKQGTRSNDAGSMMRNVVVRMSDAEMKSVAAYIAGIQ
ncbi:MAG: cytochrome c4 [Gammaproteobacteria bacterium]|nr:cytochrome c4 [Gammaproteobacteria bacterium]